MPSMRDPATGQVVEVPAEQVEQAIRAGFHAETRTESFARSEALREDESTQGVGAGIDALIAGGLRGATLGGSDAATRLLGTAEDVERLAELRRARPILSLTGEVIGGVGAAIATGGTGALGTAARLTPAGAVSSVGARILGASEGAGTLARVATGVAGGAVEGAAGGAGSYLTEVALEDKPLAAESFLASAKGGALWGGLAGGVLTAGERALVSARRLFPHATATREAAASAERAAVDEVDAALRDGDVLEAAADRRIAEIAAERRVADPAVDAALRRAEVAPPAAPPIAAGRDLSPDEVGSLISGRGRVRGGRVVPRAEADAELDIVHAATGPGKAPPPAADDLEAMLRQTQERLSGGESLGQISGAPARPELPVKPQPAKAPRKLVAVENVAPPNSGKVELADVAAERKPQIDSDLTSMFKRPTTLDDITAAYRPPEGFTVRFDNAGPAAGARGGVHVAGDIIAPDGNVAGFVSRTFRRGDDGALEVIHGDLQLYPGYWDKGVGPVISRSSLENYQKLGVDRIEIPSAMFIGRYYWLKQGYKPATEDVPLLLDKFRSWIKKDPELAPQVVKLMSDARRELNRPGGFARLAAGERPIGKQFLLAEDNGIDSFALSVKVKPGDKWYEAVRKSVGLGDSTAPELNVIRGGGGAPTRLEQELAGTLQHVQAGGSLGAAPHIAKRQALDAMDEIVAKLDPEARVLVDAKRDLRMSAAEIRDWIEGTRRRGGANTLSAAPRRGIGAVPTAAEAAVPTAVPAPVTADEAIGAALRKAEPRLDEEAADVAEVLGTHEATNANLVDALGERAPPGAKRRAAGYREAEGSASARTAQATAEAADDVARKTGGDPGLMGRVADLGAAYEVMRALGVPLPSPSRIPVIGPVLGLYLKARAASSVFRRLGGRIPKSAEAIIAAHGAEVRNRVARAVDGMMTVGTRGARTARAVGAPKWSGVLSQRLFDDGAPTPQRKNATDADLVQDRVAELARAAAPGAVRDVVRSRFPLADPALIDEMTAALERRLAYLAKNAPKTPVTATMLRGGRSDWRPSRMEILQFARRVEASADPAAVLERAAVTGEISVEAAETIRAVYPRLFVDAQMRLVERAGELKKTLPYSRRVMLSVLFDVPLDGTTEPEYVASLQNAFAPTPPPAPPAGAAPPTPSMSGDVRASDRAMMRMDR